MAAALPNAGAKSGNSGHFSGSQEQWFTRFRDISLSSRNSASPQISATQITYVRLLSDLEGRSGFYGD